MSINLIMSEETLGVSKQMQINIFHFGSNSVIPTYLLIVNKTNVKKIFFTGHTTLTTSTSRKVDTIPYI